MAQNPVNQHGRKPGRGLRPWLLIPKVLAVCCYFGSLVAMLVLWFSVPQSIDAISAIHNRLTIPALLIAMLLGGILLIHHGPILTRMVWLQLKVILSIALLFVHYRFAALFDRTLSLTPVWIALIMAALIIWLGRHKPRLGQNIAKVHRK